MKTLRLRLRSDRERVAECVADVAARLALVFPAPVLAGCVLVVPGYPEVVDALADAFADRGLHSTEKKITDFLRWRT